MGNLDNLGVIVVVLLLAAIIVVSFLVDPDGEGDGQNPEDQQATKAEGTKDPWKTLKNDGLKDVRRVDGNEDGAKGERTVRFEKTHEPVKPTKKKEEAAPAGRTPGKGRTKPGGDFAKTINAESKKEEETRKPTNKKTTAPVTNGPRPGPTGFPREVAVQANDSVWKIAMKAYGPRLGPNMVKRILAKNGIGNDRALARGSKLILPAPDAKLLAASNAPETSRSRSRPPRARRPVGAGLKFVPDSQDFAETPAGARGGSGKVYVVKPGDNLGSIALRLLGSTSKVGALKKLNGITDANRIYAGMRLKLP